MFDANLLKGKRILITGGGTGLGESMARRFAELGASLILCGRRKEVLEQAAQSIRQLGSGVETYACDIRDGNFVEKMMDDIWKSGAPDILVNNAAASFIAQSETLSHRAADAILATTLHGALYCTLAVGRRWIAGGRAGVVLSILSTSTITGRPFTLPSSIAKSGLLAMTRSLAVEWGPKAIRLVAIAPGPFPTPGATQQLNPKARATNAGSSQMNPLGRVGEPRELTNLASFLVSDGAAYINGEMVTIDGGMHLRSSGAEDLLNWSSEQWDAMRVERTGPSASNT